MTNIPTFKGGGNPASAQDFTSANREEEIRRLWTFIAGLKAARIDVGGISLASSNPPTIGGDITFTGNLTFDTSLFTLGLVAGASLSGQPNVSVTTAGVQLDQAAANPLYVRWFDSGALAAVTLYAEAGFTGDATHRLAKDIGGRLVVVGNDAPAVAAENLGKVDLTAQTADIASTALSNTPPAGLYEVEVYLLCTTADAAAGTLAVTIGWTDDVGATTSTPITLFPLTATGRTTGRQIVRVASGNITYAVAATGGYGTSAYAVYVRVISLG